MFQTEIYMYISQIFISNLCCFSSSLRAEDRFAVVHVSSIFLNTSRLRARLRNSRDFAAQILSSLPDFEQKRDCSQSATRGTQGRDVVMANDPFSDLPFLVVKNPYDLRS